MNFRRPSFFLFLFAMLFVGSPTAWAQGDDEDAYTDEERFDEPVRGAAISPARPPTEAGVRVRGDALRGERWTLDLGGFIRTRFTHIQADPNVELFGRNDGFVLDDARLITHGSLDNGLGFVLSLDAGSRLLRTRPDSPVEELAARMADTYIYYAPFDFLEFNIGQFKAPFDAEDLISTSRLLFVHRSVGNRGVQGVEGFNVEGLSQSRQVGLQALGSVFPLADSFGEFEGPGVSYAFAVANGNGPNRSINENERLAYYGRMALHWGDMVSLGGGLYHNDRTFGDPPAQTDRRRLGWTADLQVNAYGATLFANVVSQSTETPDFPDDPEVTALAYQVQIAYEEPFYGLQPAYRFAYLDPTFEYGDEVDSPIFEADARIHHTFGLNYNAGDYPVRLMANYTLTQDEQAVALENNRFDILLQLQW